MLGEERKKKGVHKGEAASPKLMEVEGNWFGG